MPDTDTRPRITPTKAVQLAALAAELGDDRLARDDESGEIVAHEDISQAALDAAVAAHLAPAPPPSLQEQIDEIKGRLDKAASVPVAAGSEAAMVRDGLKPAAQ